MGYFNNFDNEISNKYLKNLKNRKKKTLMDMSLYL
jgi:hypothetical protein